MEQRIKDIIIEQLNIPKDVALEASLIDLGMDDLDSVELVMSLEEEYGIDIPDEDWEKIKTVKDVIEYVKTKKKG